LGLQENGEDGTSEDGGEGEHDGQHDEGVDPEERKPPKPEKDEEDDEDVFTFRYYYRITNADPDDPTANAVLTEEVREMVEKRFGEIVRGEIRFQWIEGQAGYFERGTGRRIGVGDFVPAYNVGKWMGEWISGAYTPTQVVVNINLNMTKKRGALAQEDNYEVTVYPKRIEKAMDASTAEERRFEFGLANTLLHEIGFHAYAGFYDFSAPAPKGERFLDTSRQQATVNELFGQLGRFSEMTEKEIRRELDL
jgi:hypothetical protein